MWLMRIHSGHVIGTAALLAPMLGVFGPKLIAPLAILATLALFALSARDGGIRRPDKLLAAIVGSLLIWISLSFIWSNNRWDALEKWPIVIAVGAAIVFLPSEGPKLSMPALGSSRRLVLLGIALGFSFLFVELVTENTLSRHLFGKELVTVELFNRANSVLSVFVWPAVAILWRKSLLMALGLIVLGLGAGYFLPSASALIGFVSGTTAFFCALWMPRVMGAIVAATISLGILTAPILPAAVPQFDPGYWLESPKSANPSLVHRLDIWQFTVKRIAERPILGWGFNASREIPGGDTHYFLRDSSDRIIGQGNRLPLHPHNGALQVWLELGLPGALGFSALFGLAAFRAGRGTHRTHSAMALAVVSTIAPIWLLSFGIWQGWWIGVILLALLLTTSLYNRGSDRQSANENATS